MLRASQPEILRAAPATARFTTFAFTGNDARIALRRLGKRKHDPHTLVGLGAPLVAAAGGAIEGLRGFPDDLGLFPETQGALWAFFGHADPGHAFDAARRLAADLGPSFRVAEDVAAFTYRGGRDLSGFEDGTENPTGAAAVSAAIIDGKGPGLDGGSFVAVQRWVHDLDALERMTEAAKNAVVGRRLRDNRELPDAPPSAHVKRTEQESFDPPTFVLRKSMPWGGPGEHGLYFVAFGESLDRFERLLRRMAGSEDGIPDALLSFTRATTGGYYFCPPVRRWQLDLQAIREPLGGPRRRARAASRSRRA